ncbi:MAG: Gfo/Idh/MocA family oxidoreductase [Caldilineaceae bacterium]|nr:Gfo/Idh/MocA family oxidoreductase [Caldilineaceae bacterium]
MGVVRIGVLGAARIAPKALLEPAAQNRDVDVVAVAARDPAQARAFAETYGIPKVHNAYDALIADPAIDAIYNPLPNSLHGEWSIRALRAGKHVLCEKPLAANATEAATMATVAEETGLVLMEAFHTIYHPLAGRLREIVAGGELGTLQQVEAHFCTLLRRRDDIRLNYALGGGAMMDLGCYPIRLLRFVLGTEPEVVHATATCYTPQIDRKMVVELRFPRDITGHVSCAFWSRRLIRITARIVGDQGEVHVLKPLLPHLFHLVRVRTKRGLRIERCPGQSTYAYQLQAFVQSVRGEAPCISDGWDGVATMRTIDATYGAAGLERRQPFTDSAGSANL